MTKKSLQSSGLSKQGLPNIGNSCFLNAALQGLYSVDEFRMRVLDDNHSQRENLMTFHIRQAFSALHHGLNNQQKQRIMKNFQQLLIQQIADYSGHSHQDSSMFLLHILKHLGEENTSYNDFFYHNIIIRCKYCVVDDIEIQDEVFLHCDKLICSNSPNQAPHEAEIYFTKVPNGLILLSQAQIKQQIQLKVFHDTQKISLNHDYKIKDKTKVFGLKAVILYSGDQIKGHYVCLRKTQKYPSKYILVNDSSVSKPKKLTEFNLQRYQPRLYFYEETKPYFQIKTILFQPLANNTQRLESSEKLFYKNKSCHSRQSKRSKIKNKQAQFQKKASLKIQDDQKYQDNSLSKYQISQKSVHPKGQTSFFRIILNNLCRYMKNICS